MKKTKIILLSGFLGAGKTTLMLSVAGHLRSRGMTVACITNDQGDQLVDSKMVLVKEIPLQQVQGGCFCCKFENLVDSIKTIILEKQPDVIIAEAVGSCTDLVATVIKPLKEYHGEMLDIRPLTVVLDPQRFKDLTGTNSSNFSSEVSYLFRKQIEEAQCLLLNKIDLTSEEEIQEILFLLDNEIPSTQKIPVSAITQKGINEWLDSILYVENKEEPVLDIDYDIYAKGEEQLGWLNTSIAINGDISDVMMLTRSLMDKLLEQFRLRNVEIAHLKVWTEGGGNYIKISSVRSKDDYNVDLKTKSQWSTRKLDLWINARINIDFLELKLILENSLKEIERENRFELIIKQMDCFAPSRPIPTYRMS